MANNDDVDTFCVSKLKVLADPTRLSVLRMLMDGPKNVSDLMTALDVEQSLLSHHLRALRNAELVIVERSGKTMLYELAAGVKGSSAAQTIDLGCCRLAFEKASTGAGNG